MTPDEPGREGTFGSDDSSSGPAGSSPTRGDESPRVSISTGMIIKLLFLAAVNAAAMSSLPAMYAQRWWGGLAAVVVATVLIDIAYLTKRAIPLKYLVPGTIFALIFQVIPVIYTGYIAFTNYGTGNVLTKEQALDNIDSRVSNVPGATRYQIDVLAGDGGLGDFALLLTDDEGVQFLGTPDGLQDVEAADVVTSDTGRVLEVDGLRAPWPCGTSPTARTNSRASSRFRPTKA